MEIFWCRSSSAFKKRKVTLTYFVRLSSSAPGKNNHAMFVHFHLLPTTGLPLVGGTSGVQLRAE